MKTSASVFGIFTITTALLIVGGTTAEGQSSQIFVNENWTIGANKGFTGSLSIPQFDPALGVLDSVSLEFSTSYSSSVVVSGPVNASGNIAANADITFQDPGMNINRNFGLSWEGHFSLPSSAGVGGVGNNFDLAPVSYNSPAVLSEFTGNGNFNLQVAGSQSFSQISGPAVSIDNIQNASFNGSAVVTYDYTAVPEPSACSLLVIGSGMMLIAQKSWKFA
jgi:hypothetical protein